eukprot:1335601-Amorphochlora_amoeboformis.AAC.1
MLLDDAEETSDIAVSTHYIYFATLFTFLSILINDSVLGLLITGFIRLQAISTQSIFSMGDSNKSFCNTDTSRIFARRHIRSRTRAHPSRGTRRNLEPRSKSGGSNDAKKTRARNPRLAGRGERSRNRPSKTLLKNSAAKPKTIFSMESLERKPSSGITLFDSDSEDEVVNERQQRLLDAWATSPTEPDPRPHTFIRTTIPMKKNITKPSRAKPKPRTKHYTKPDTIPKSPPNTAPSTQYTVPESHTHASPSNAHRPPPPWKSPQWSPPKGAEDVLGSGAAMGAESQPRRKVRVKGIRTYYPPSALASGRTKPLILRKETPESVSLRRPKSPPLIRRKKSPQLM